MNFTKRRLTPAQIAKLDSVRLVKEQKLAKINKNKVAYLKQKETVIRFLPKGGENLYRINE